MVEVCRHLLPDSQIYLLKLDLGGVQNIGKQSKEKKDKKKEKDEGKDKKNSGIKGIRGFV